MMIDIVSTSNKAIDIPINRFSFISKLKPSAKASIKEWGEYIQEKRQEAIDEEGCGVVFCEYHAYLWEIYDAFIKDTTDN